MYKTISIRRWRDVAVLGIATAVALVAVGKAVSVGFSARKTAVTSNTPTVSLPILMYHSILDDPTHQGTYVISPQQLESDLKLLKQRGYHTVVMADLIAYVDEGTPLPEKPIMLTFDDGYYNNQKFAYPLLQQYGMKAVLSPVVYWTELYSESDSDHPLYSHVTWDECRQLVDSGVFEIQNHSYNMHDATGKKTRKGVQKRAGESVETYQTAMRDDIGKAQQRLTEELGKTPTTFTYPFGVLCEDVIPVLRDLGFRATLTCEDRVNSITRDADCLMGLGRTLRSDKTDLGACLNRLEKQS